MKKDLNSLLEPFHGYLELDMYDDANEVLDNLPEELKAQPKVLSCRLEILMLKERWEEGVILGESLCKLWPRVNEFWFRTAYCQHELQQTAEAKATLLTAPPSIRSEALFDYNLACYLTQLGDVEKAKVRLKECFRKEPDMKATALNDPDLEPIWD